MTEAALGIDIGTGSAKAGLIDASGRLLAVGRSAHDIDQPGPGRSESDPVAWLDSAASAIGRALATATAETGRPVEIVGVGFSGQMHGVVLCDVAGVPVRPAVLWSDRRSQPDLVRLRDRLGPDGVATLGNPVVAGMAGPTIAALHREEPAVMKATSAVVQPKDWVRSQLTGGVFPPGPDRRPLTDPSDASATLLWDLAGDRWWPEACSVFGIEAEWLPEVRPSDGSAGVVSTEGGVRFGVEPGLPVAVGAADTAAALLGAGVRSGEAQLSTGTGGQIARLTDDPSPVAESGTSRSIHRFRAAEVSTLRSEPRWYEMAAIQNAGIAVDWALAVLGLDLAGAAAAVARSPIGANGVTFLPYLTGERTPHLDADLCGGWTGLRSGTGRSDLVRSVFEGVAFALRDGLDALGRTGAGADGGADGGAGDQLLLAGGGSAADWWQQMLADVLDVPLVPHNATDASVRGAGLLAWSALGVAIDPAAEVRRSAPVVPSPPAVDRYRPALARFRHSLPAAGPIR